MNALDDRQLGYLHRDEDPEPGDDDDGPGL